MNPKPTETRQRNLLLKGVGVSPGIIVGKAFLFASADIEVSPTTLATKAEITRDINRFKQAPR